jgi:hypothetical protein
MNIGVDDGFWTPVVRSFLPDGRAVEAETLTGARPAAGKVGERSPCGTTRRTPDR